MYNREHNNETLLNKPFIKLIEKGDSFIRFIYKKTEMHIFIWRGQKLITKNIDNYLIHKNNTPFETNISILQPFSF